MSDFKNDITKKNYVCPNCDSDTENSDYCDQCRIKMILPKKLINELHEALDRAGGCNAQHTGWTCGTCFFSINPKFSNRSWQTVLAVRGDTKLDDLKNLPKDIKKGVIRIIKIANEN